MSSSSTSASAAHQTPAPGSTCLCCFEDLTTENYVEYQPYTDKTSWSPSAYCQSCVEYLLSTQFKLFQDNWAKTTCKAEQRRLITRGPPVNLRDDKALPCPDNTEVHLLWYSSDNTVKIAKLTGSFEGEVSAHCTRRH